MENEANLIQFDFSDLINQLVSIFKQVEKQTLYVCGLCGKVTQKITKHHYNYFPPKIIYVCPRCNNPDYLEKNHPLLNPSVFESRVYHKDFNLDDTEFRKLLNETRIEIDKMLDSGCSEKNMRYFGDILNALREGIENELIKHSLDKMVDY